MDTTSISLLERVCQPTDGQAWQRFVDLYSPLLYFWARRGGLNEADAEDFVQEVFLHLVKILPLFVYNPQKRFRGWLWTVARNKLRERQRRRETLPGDGTPVEDVAVTLTDEVMERDYQQFVIGRALELLKTDFQPKTWQACWQHLMEGKTAAELGWTDGALRAAKFRVLSRLRRELAGLIE